MCIIRRLTIVSLSRDLTLSYSQLLAYKSSTGVHDREIPLKVLTEKNSHFFKLDMSKLTVFYFL